MIEILFFASSLISILAFAAISLYSGLKFFKVWRLFREEALFHLFTLSLGLVVYFIVISGLVLWYDPSSSIVIIVRMINPIYSFLCLEMSLFYLSAFVNRRIILEKYIPWTYGITFGLAVALTFVSENDPFYPVLFLISFGFPILLVGFIGIRVLMRIREIIRTEDIEDLNKAFLNSLMIVVLALGVGAGSDILLLALLILSNAEFWSILILLIGIIGPIILVSFTWFMRDFFRNLEKANVPHLFNMLS
ncbi:MAG: hypothetical protein ACFFE8_02160 [Candidatus Heimdallarchaeota archaeon]